MTYASYWYTKKADAEILAEHPPIEYVVQRSRGGNVTRGEVMADWDDIISDSNPAPMLASAARLRINSRLEVRILKIYGPVLAIIGYDAHGARRIERACEVWLEMQDLIEITRVDEA